MGNFDSTLPSPCLRKCCLDDEGTCLGCFRSLEEIRKWAATDNQRRHAILSNATQRREACNNVLGGWKAPSVDEGSAHAILPAFGGDPVMEPKPAPLTPSEYLDGEGRSPIKREYVDGSADPDNPSASHESPQASPPSPIRLSAGALPAIRVVFHAFMP